MNKSKKLVFFGNERLATGVSSTDPIVLKSLLAQGYEICTILAKYIKGKSRNARELEVAEIAKQHNIPLLLPEKLEDAKNELKALGADAAVLVAYGNIIPKNIIALFPKGIINIHPSLLPKYRGPTPIEQAILDGANETGVSIMQLSEKMDAGPVYIQQKIVLSETNSKAEIAQKLLNVGSELLIKYLPQILDSSLLPTPQDDSQATYTKLIDKKDGYIDWSKPAQYYEREVRAYIGYPKSRAKIEDYEVIITKAHAVTRPYELKGIIRHCANNTALEIEELIAPSGRTMSGVEFLRGYV